MSHKYKIGDVLTFKAALAGVLHPTVRSLPKIHILTLSTHVGETGTDIAYLGRVINGNGIVSPSLTEVFEEELLPIPEEAISAGDQIMADFLSRAQDAKAKHDPSGSLRPGK